MGGEESLQSVILSETKNLTSIDLSLSLKMTIARHSHPDESGKESYADRSLSHQRWDQDDSEVSS